MNQTELKSKLNRDFQALVNDLAAAQVVVDNGNPFDRVTLNPKFLGTMLTTPVMSDEELKVVLDDIDAAIQRNDDLREVANLVGTGLSLLAKYGVLA